MKRNKRIGLLGTAILLSIVWGPGRPVMGEPPHPGNPKPNTSAFKMKSECAGEGFQTHDLKAVSDAMVA